MIGHKITQCGAVSKTTRSRCRNQACWGDVRCWCHGGEHDVFREVIKQWKEEWTEDRRNGMSQFKGVPFKESR